MHFATYILTLTGTHGFLREACRVRVAVAAMFISRDQINPVADRLTDKAIEGGCQVLDNCPF